MWYCAPFETRRLNGQSVWVDIANHNGRKYLKTRADGYEPNNLLSLPAIVGKADRLELRVGFVVRQAQHFGQTERPGLGAKKEMLRHLSSYPLLL